jgi:hypothetical protein
MFMGLRVTHIGPRGEENVNLQHYPTVYYHSAVYKRQALPDSATGRPDVNKNPIVSRCVP